MHLALNENRTQEETSRLSVIELLKRKKISYKFTKMS